MSVQNEAIKLAKERGFYYDAMGDVYSSYGYKLKPFSSKGGYLYFSVKAGEKSTFGRRRNLNVKVHKFIAYGKYGELALAENVEVRHLNGNLIDNSPINLALGSHSENQMDIAENKRLVRATYASSFIRKFTDEQEDEIRVFYNRYHSYKGTMRKFGVKKATLHYILHKAS